MLQSLRNLRLHFCGYWSGPCSTGIRPARLCAVFLGGAILDSQLGDGILLIQDRLGSLSHKSVPISARIICRNWVGELRLPLP
jgi:hypothetical protein